MTQKPSPENSREFRNALSNFATGVTVITALSPDNKPIGVTIGSFTSLSLDPPLILWSLALTSCCVDAFRQAKNFSVNVLAADQQGLSDCFAAKTGDRFSELPVRQGLWDVPLIEGCCAWFECSNEAQYPGGDHVILVGRVERFSQGEVNSPLVFHKARYRHLAD